MNPFDQLKAFIRTMWPVIVGGLTGLLVTWIGDKIGIEVDSNVVMVAVTTVLVGIIYGLGRWLEKRDNAFLAGLGRWLVSLGMDLGQPTYVKADAAAKPLAGAPPPRR